MEKCYIGNECFDLVDGIDFSQDIDTWLEFLTELEDENNVMKSLLELAKENYINVRSNDMPLSYPEYEKIMLEQIACNVSCINFISERLV